VTVSAEDVSRALEYLYDTAALAEVPLASHFPQVATKSNPYSRAQHLRTILMEGIELLQPSRPASFRSAAARSYEVLALRFIEGLSMAEIAEELHISRRQAYRDMDRAVEGLAKLLNSYPWPVADRVSEDEPEEAARQDDPLLGELRHVSKQSERVDLTRVLAFATQTVEPMASQWNTEVRCEMPEASQAVFANEALLKQTLVQMLSAAIRNTATQSVKVHTATQGTAVSIFVEFQLNQLSGEIHGFANARRLAQVQRLSWQERTLDRGCLQISIAVPTKQRHLVLVIEDNKGAVELYRRYLSSSDDWQVIEAPDPRVSFEMARRLRPAVIVLDILMSEQDGWSVLQLLRTQPETCGIPVLICSVFDELDLAAALGATAYLKKPVSRFELVAALQKCLGWKPAGFVSMKVSLRTARASSPWLAPVTATTGRLASSLSLRIASARPNPSIPGRTMSSRTSAGFCRRIFAKASSASYAQLTLAPCPTVSKVRRTNWTKPRSSSTTSISPTGARFSASLMSLSLDTGLASQPENRSLCLCQRHPGREHPIKGTPGGSDNPPRSPLHTFLSGGRLTRTAWGCSRCTSWRASSTPRASLTSYPSRRRFK